MLGTVVALRRNELVLPNNFLREEGQELLVKHRIEITDPREMSQTTASG